MNGVPSSSTVKPFSRSSARHGSGFCDGWFMELTRPPAICQGKVLPYPLGWHLTNMSASPGLEALQSSMEVCLAQISTNTNVERLKEAGLIPDETQLSAGHLEIIQSLTTDEVTQLIALRDRLGGSLSRQIRSHQPPSSSDRAAIGEVRATTARVGCFTVRRFAVRLSCTPPPCCCEPCVVVSPRVRPPLSESLAVVYAVTQASVPLMEAARRC